MEYFIDALRKFADFNGRARRKQYWMFCLVYVLIVIALSLIDEFVGTSVLSIIFTTIMLVPSISIAARRLHDTGRSGWWQLIAIIPLIGGIVLIVFLAQDSHGDNDYGVSPKATISA